MTFLTLCCHSEYLTHHVQALREGLRFLTALRSHVLQCLLLWQRVGNDRLGCNDSHALLSGCPEENRRRAGDGRRLRRRRRLKYA